MENSVLNNIFCSTPNSSVAPHLSVDDISNVTELSQASAAGPSTSSQRPQSFISSAFQNLWWPEKQNIESKKVKRQSKIPKAASGKAALEFFRNEEIEKKKKEIEKEQRKIEREEKKKTNEQIKLERKCQRETN
jgi:hypothetical protein